MQQEYITGFLKDAEESSTCVLKPELGNIPEWLSGVFVKVGPAQFNLGNEQVKHWFDGLAMLYRFNFKSGVLQFQSKFLESQARRVAIDTKRLSSAEFASKPKQNFIQRFWSLASNKLTDNCNVNVVSHAGQMIAMTETVNWLNFNCSDLSTNGPYHFNDSLHAQISTAHPHADPRNGALTNLLINLSITSDYLVYQSTGNSRQLICKIKRPRPAYIHSFAITERFIIIMECPLLLNPFDMFRQDQPYIENYRWQPQQGTLLQLIDKDSGSCKTMESETCFAFHHINAYETKNEIVLDFVAYEDSSIIQAFYFKALLSGSPPIEVPKLRRIIIDTLKGCCRSVPMPAVGLEFPRIDYRFCNGRPYKYVFAASASKPDSFLDSLIKVNTDTGDSLRWHEEYSYPGEPVFVKEPGAIAEDAGILLSMATNTKSKRSFLLLHDACNMQEIARAYLPTMVPFALHGQFFDEFRGGI